VTHVSFFSIDRTVTVTKIDVTLLSDDVDKTRAVVKDGRERTIYPITLAEYNRLRIELTGGRSEAGK